MSLWSALGRSIFGASDLTGILGCFDRARQSRRFFNMFGGLVRLVIRLNQLRLRSLKLFFDRRFPRHFDFSLALHGPNIDPANWLRCRVMGADRVQGDALNSEASPLAIPDFAARKKREPAGSSHIPKFEETHAETG